MWFGYNPQIIFYHFFCYFNLGIFLAFLLSKLINNNGGGHKFSEFACYISVYLSDRASVTAQKGDYIREKFGSVGVIYLELRA